jgi:hypothetical protein
MTLDEIAISFTTDKVSWLHNYMNFYEQFLEKIRYSKVRILEIGVGEGGSLKTWNSYFENAEIILGIDNENKKQYEGARIAIEIGDQGDKEFLLSIGEKYGPFDLILDDGSHIGKDQVTSLQHLISFVKRGGYYIVEDLGCAFLDGKPRSGSVIYPLTLISMHIAGNKPIEDNILSPILTQLESIHFYYETCVMKIGRPSTPFIKDYHSSANF